MTDKPSSTPNGRPAASRRQRPFGRIVAGADGLSKCPLFTKAIFPLCLLFAGCASAPVAPPAAGFWIQGKIGVVEGDEAHSARFVWALHGDAFNIDLWGPFGQGHIRLRAFNWPNADQPARRRQRSASAAHWNDCVDELPASAVASQPSGKAQAPPGARLQRGGTRRLEILDGTGTVLAAGCPQSLMLEHLGWSLPLDFFLDWMNGRPSERAPTDALTRDANGRLRVFEQLGWRISYGGFSRPHGGLPTRITAEKPGSRVRVNISKRREARPPTAESW